MWYTTFLLLSFPITCMSKGFLSCSYEYTSILSCILEIIHEHMEPIPLPIQWAPGALPLGVKRPERETDHSPPSSAEVKE